MKQFEKQFKEDFEKSKKIDLSFDVRQLEPNMPSGKRKLRGYEKAIIIVASLQAVFIVAPIAFYILKSLRIEDSVKEYKRAYTVNEIKIAESNTFKKLNDVHYPDGQNPEKNEILEDEKESYNNFSNTTYHALVDNSKKDNMSYSVAGLYSIINELDGAACRDDLKDRLNNLLGLNEESRSEFYQKMIKANSFGRKNTTIQLKNSAFFTSRFDYSPEYVEYLTRLYCEAYQIDFNTEADKMVEWVNQAVNSNGFVDDKFLDLQDDTCLYLFSTLYFKNAWYQKYVKKNNIKDNFYLSNGDIVKTTYMKHSYMTDGYYDYGRYISFKDYYYNNHASVTYIVPKSISDNIFTLTKNVNIFEEDESKFFELENGGRITVNLTTPKFNNSSEVNFKESLFALGFDDIYDEHIKSFNNAFTSESIESFNVCIQDIKQKSEVEFNEDGTVVKTVAWASFLAAGAMPKREYDTIDVELNQPFIYIIRDVNDTPIFVGHVDNPTLS